MRTEDRLILNESELKQDGVEVWIFERSFALSPLRFIFIFRNGKMRKEADLLRSYEAGKPGGTREAETVSEREAPQRRVSQMQLVTNCILSCDQLAKVAMRFNCDKWDLDIFRMVHASRAHSTGTKVRVGKFITEEGYVKVLMYRGGLG